MEQSHWEQLTQPTREQKVFSDVYRRFADAHDKRWKNRTKADDLCGSPLDPQPGRQCPPGPATATQSQGLGWEDLYDYGGDGNLGNGDFGGGGGGDFGDAGGFGP